MARSVPLIIRVMISVQAQASAETSGKNAAGWKAPVPGRRMISTPIRPTPVAIQRRMPTFSPRNTIDSAVTSSGATKPVAEASAIGRNRRPEMKNSDEPRIARPRIRCSPSRLVCSANSGEPGIIAGVMISANTRNLIHAISIEGNVAERYFAVTSDAPRKIVEASTSAMPLNGLIGARGSLAGGGLLLGQRYWGAVQPGGCGGGRCHGNLERQ